jgi:hypothetical protein
MSLDFNKFKKAVADKFNKMQKHDIFAMAVEKDDLWNTYLESFPAGTNPMYRQRTEHDCSCCKSFIRSIGHIVTIIDGQLSSIWDVDVGDPAYQVVADELSRLVKSKAIDNIFLSKEHKAGTDKNFEMLLGESKQWQHFFVNIDRKFFCDGPNIGPRLSQSRATHDVMKRGLEEISIEACDIVLDLIAQNSLYRGSEHKVSIEKFRALRNQYARVQDKDAFIWENMNTVHAAASRIRNTSIGTLLLDISNDVDLEQAVNAFERMVAPQSYKRPTALVTKQMVANAKKKIEELGLTSALERRYAVISDITINNIIFANREAKKAMNAGVFDELLTKSSTPKNLDKIETITIDKFIADVVPKVTSIDLLVENKHKNNLVSLVAPVDPTANNMFKWNNGFSWSYNGDFADSIKERVKKAGGNVTGDLCCRLSWSNYDDLDFHMLEPNRAEICFSRKGPSTSGGRLDVDMNAGGGSTRTPVENIFYADRNLMKEGVYKLYVNQFSKRESTDVGFEVEIDMLGDVYNFYYEKAVKQGERIEVAQIKYSKSKGFEIIESLPSSRKSTKMWNINTNDFHQVNVLMHSPNHWDDKGVGNKHYFFMLKDCKNDGQARGFFNEFLKEELNPHRKVIEMVGSKMKTDNSADQLSGLGFSSTQKAELLVRVKGAMTRTLKVMI